MHRRIAALAVVIMAGAACSASAQEPWTESLDHWSLVAHGDAEQGVAHHAANLRLDRGVKRFGEASLAFDVVEPKVGVYTELRLTLPEPLDARPFDVLHVSYRVPPEMKLPGFRVGCVTHDWQHQARMPELLRGEVGEWQDLAIPLAALSVTQGEWDWSQVGNIVVHFFWYQDAGQPGTVHVDGLWLERMGQGIGNTVAPPSILFLDYYEPNRDIDAVHRKRLEDQGYLVAWEVIQKLTEEKLRQFNVVVLGFHPQVDLNHPEEWVKLHGVRGWFERYVREGGGLLLTGTPDNANAATGVNLLTAPMGLELINEQVTDPQGVIYRQELFPKFTYAHTDQVAPGPLTDGVRGLWYGTSLQFTGGGGGAFTAAVVQGPEWEALVQAAPSAATHRFMGSFGIEMEPGRVKSAPVLCAARTLEQGRVAVLPLNPTHLWLSGYHPWWEGLVMSRGASGKPSDAEQLLLNLYAWLAEPGRAAGAPGGYLGDAPVAITGARYVSQGDEGGVIDWSSLPPPESRQHQYVGLIGAHSAFSDGEGTVAEWVAAAQQAGYDWIAFTEPYEQMNPGKWAQLKQECADHTGETFAAIPGLQLVDPAGNHSLVLGPIPFPDPGLVGERMDLPQAIGYAYNFPTQIQYRLKQGLAPWYRNQFHFVGVYTYRAGELVEEAEQEYWELQARTFKVWPVAVHETFRPAEVALARRTGYQTWYTFGPLERMWQEFCFCNPQHFWHHDLVYVSSGPRLDRFHIANNGTTYFDIPPEWRDSWRETIGADRWRITARAASAEGLTRLRLVDAERPLREFSCGGESEYAVVVDGHHDRQYCFGVIVEDAAGGRALASAANTSAGRHWFGNCGDNVNLMEGGTWGPTEQVPKGFECYFARWGVHLWPQLLVQDAEPLNLPHDERLEFASTDCTIVDHWFRFTHSQEVLPVGGGRMMRPLHPLRDFEARQRVIFFTPGIDTPIFKLYEAQVTLRRDVTVQDGAFPNLRLLYAAHGEPTTEGEWLFAAWTLEDGRTLVQQTPAELTWPRTVHQGTLPAGGYVAAFPNSSGSLAVFALEPGLQYAVEGNHKSRRVQIGRQVKPGTVLPAGTVLSARVLSMEGKWRQLAGNAEIEDARKLLGLAGEPGYSVTPTVGRVADTLYTCTLEPEGGAFRAQFSQAPLPVDLPIVVRGLNPRWDAGVWIPGNPRHVRHFGIYEGAGYTTLRLTDGPVEAFLGHPIVCDAEELWLSLVEADEQHLQVVVHNPTQQPVQTTVRKNRGFELGPPLEQTVTVPAGASVTVTAGDT